MKPIRVMRIMRLMGLWLLPVLVAACGGSGLHETPEPGYAYGPAPTPPATSSETPAATSSTPAATPATTTTPPASSGESDGDQDYAASLGSAVTAGFRPPGRDSSTPPRSAVVVVRLNAQGRVMSWDFQRRSPQRLFNQTVEEYLDDLMSSGQRFPLPTSGEISREDVFNDGVPIEFKDDDA